MRNIFNIIGIITLCLFSSCNMDDLYYAYSENVNVKLNLDWSKTLLTPNGASAYLFEHNTGNAVGKVVISNDPSTIKLDLPVGVFDILVINDTEYELENIEFQNISNINEFAALITASTDSKYKEIPARSDNLFVTECDELAYGIVEKLTIDKKDVEYYKYRPSSGSSTIYKEVGLTLTHVTEFIDIEITVENINSVAGAPRSHLTDVAGGYFLGRNMKSPDLVTHEFALNNRMIDHNNYKIGKISKQLISFGPHMLSRSSLANQHKLLMNFVLINGEQHPIDLDINDITDSQHDGFRMTHKIRATITLPETIGNGDGPFNPDVEEWEDIIIGLPI